MAIETFDETRQEPVRDPLDETRCWRAVCRRERARPDFVYAVLTTGVFCRPGCPSRRPRRENVVFHADAAAAAASGFRPCRRCRPAARDDAPVWLAAAARAFEADPARTVSAVADEVGVQRATLHRGFVRALGLSPAAYRAAVRARRLRDALGDGRRVTDALLEAGHGSLSAGHAAARAELGDAPGRAVRGGSRGALTWAAATTGLGELLVAWTDAGLALVEFLDDETAEDRLAARFPGAPTRIGPMSDAVRAVVDHVDGTAPPPSLPLDVRGTAFQRRVWDALRALAPGEQVSYGELARRIDRPGAARAVAGACAANPLAVVVPCHRVVPAAGGIGGYRWGTDRKRRLLARESGDESGEESEDERGE